MYTAVVMNVEVEITSATSVRVSWDRLDIPELTGYIVYYSQRHINTIEQSVNASSGENSVIINNLLTGVEYQFEVVAVAELLGDVATGERLLSERVTCTVLISLDRTTTITVLIPLITTIPTDSDTNVSDLLAVYVFGGVVAFILAALMVVLVLCYVW